MGDGARYKFEIRTQSGGLLLKVDPYAFATEVPPKTASVVFRPEHDWGDRTAWRMFNAATFALTGRVMDSDVTPSLFKVIDGVCEHAE